MRISNFTTRRPEMADTRTYEDFSKFLGASPIRMGLVASLYKHCTASFLTESLQNVYLKDKPKQGVTSIDAFAVEWDINVNQIKRIPFKFVPEGDGSNGSDITFYFNERYYEKNDIFVIEETRQQIIVTQVPVRRSDDLFEVVGQIMDSDYSSILDPSGSYIGSETRFITNAHSELSEQGYTKYQSNIEKHRSHITFHRCDISWSSQYAAKEDKFLKVSNDKNQDVVFKFDGVQKQCLDSLMMARNNAMLWAKTNVDKNGKVKHFDQATGLPIVVGDGIISQIERFADKYVFGKLNIRLFNQILTNLALKSDNHTGNTFTFICNTLMYAEVQNTLGEWMKQNKTQGTYLYSQAKGGQVDVGATYNSYEFAGNKIIFMVDRSMDIEYPSKKYAIFIDMTADMESGKPAMELFTFKNGHLVTNTITGVGGKDGLTSGEVSTPVAGSRYVAISYSGAGVYAPYKAAIMQEA